MLKEILNSTNPKTSFHLHGLTRSTMEFLYRFFMILYKKTNIKVYKSIHTIPRCLDSNFAIVAELPEKTIFKECTKYEYNYIDIPENKQTVDLSNAEDLEIEHHSILGFQWDTHKIITHKTDIDINGYYKCFDAYLLSYINALYANFNYEIYKTQIYGTRFYIIAKLPFCTYCEDFNYVYYPYATMPIKLLDIQTFFKDPGHNMNEIMYYHGFDD